MSTYRFSPVAQRRQVSSRPAKRRLRLDSKAKIALERLEERCLLSTGLVAAFSFDEGAGSTVSDVSGNGNNGTTHNTTWTASGKYGSALNFNGSNAFVTVNDSASLHLSSGMTLEAWVNPKAVSPSWRDVIYKGTNSSDSYYLEATSIYGSVPMGGARLGAPASEAEGAQPLATHTWTHLAVTYGGASMRLYVNGTQISSVSGSGNILTTNGVLQIGGDSVWGQYFKGAIDEVRIYDFALNQSQIRADMSTPIGASTPPPADTTAPTVVSESPASGASGVALGSTVTGTFSEAVQSGTIGFVLKDGSGTTIPSTTSYNATNWVATLTPTSALAYSTTYTATLSGATDASGNVMKATSWSFTTAAAPAADTTAPTVVSESPASGASGVALGSTVTGTFSEAVQSGTIGFVLKDGSGTTIPSTTSYNATNWVATLTPTSALAYSTTYTATLSGAKDASGNVMKATSWSFTTAAAPADTTAPTVVSESPASGASGIALGSTVTGTFSEAVQSGTIGFVLKDGSGTTIPSTTSYNATNWVATLTPTMALAYSTTYTATLSGATDASGNVMKATSWSFTTTAAAPTQSGGSSSGLVAAFSFDEGTGSTVSDVSGNGNNGTTHNTTWTASGKYGSALDFNGSNALVTVNDSASLHLSSGMTLEAWVNPTAVSPSWRDVIYKGTNSDDSYYLEATSIYGSVPMGGARLGAPASEAEGAQPLATHTWTHLAVTYGGASMRLYVNGTQISSVSGSGNILTTNGALQIGGDSVWGQYFQGSIDEVRIYDFALNQSQIRADMSTPIGASTPPPADTTAPTVVSESPASGASGVALGSTVTGTFSEAVQSGTIGFVLKDGSGTTIPSTTSYNATNWVATLTPTMALAYSTTYTATLSGATDASGNVMKATSWSFTTAAAPAADTTAPTVVSESPASGASGVALGSTVTGTFSEAVQSGTIGFVLKDGSGTTMPSATSYNATNWVATLTPTMALAYSTTYTATLSGATDASGNVMKATSWSFTTAAAPAADTTAPTVVSESPASGATGVAVGSAVTGTFSEAVQSGTIGFVLKDDAGTTIPSTTSYNATNWVATLTPTSALAYSTTYTATLSGATDASGNVMKATSWSFTTIAAAAVQVGGDSITFQNYDGLTSPPTNPLGGGRLYPEQGTPNGSGEGGVGVLSIDNSDAVSGSSLLNHMTSGRLYLAWWNNNGSTWNFAHETKSDPAAWQFNTYNRMVLWVKMPNFSQSYETDGGYRIELGTYVKRITNEDPYSQETGGGHFYHQINPPSLGAWTQVVINMHPDHQRGVYGDPGDQSYPTVAGGDPAATYNYFDALTSFYLDIPYEDPTNLPADFLVDNVQFMTVPYQENDAQVRSLTGTYVPASNRVVVTWNAGWGDSSTHEVRYSFSDIHETGWNAATPAPDGFVPLNASGYDGRVYDSSALPLAGHSMVYIAIKPQNSDLFTQIAVPLSGFGGSNASSSQSLVAVASSSSTLSASSTAQQDATAQNQIGWSESIAPAVNDLGSTTVSSSSSSSSSSGTIQGKVVPGGPAQAGGYHRWAINQQVAQKTDLKLRRLINDGASSVGAGHIGF